MLDKLPLKALDGKKTYLTAFLTVVFSISGLLLGDIETSDAIAYLLAAFGLVGIGHKMDKSAPKSVQFSEPMELRSFTPNLQQDHPEE